MDNYLVAWIDKDGNSRWITRDSKAVIDKIKERLEHEIGNHHVRVFVGFDHLL